MALSYTSFLLRAGVALTTLALTSAAQAGSFTVHDGETVNTQTLDTAGDVGLIEAGGVITGGGGGPGVNATADHVTVINKGSILNKHEGINVLNNNRVRNTGTISGSVTAIFGIDGNDVRNTGTLNGSNGIILGSNNTVFNSGVSSGSKRGINVINDNVVTNTGSASGGIYGIELGSRNTVFNSGQVVGGNGGVFGFDGNSITNSGSIESFTFGFLVGNDNTITNMNFIHGLDDGINAGSGNTILNTGRVEGNSLSAITALDGNNISNLFQAYGGTDGIHVRDNNTITNAGTTAGQLQHGISGGNGNTITNSGMANGHLDGIHVNNNNTITVTKTGTAMGIFDYGIHADGDFNTISNAGTAHGGNTGIFADGNGNDISNAGTVTGDSNGIYAIGSHNQISNSGTVTGSSVGIYSRNNNNFVRNSGVVTGGNIGIQARGNFITTINSGTVASSNIAYVSSGLSNTLTLLAGSDIRGQLQLFDVSNTLIIGPGLNTALSYVGGTIETNGLPAYDSGSVVYAVDVTGFSVQDELANELAGAVADAIDGRLTSAGAAGGNGLSTAMNGQVIHATADVPDSDTGAVWMSALGSAASQDGSSMTDAYDSLMGGFVIGADSPLSENTRAGVFAGLSSADLETDGGAQDLSSDSIVGGVYLGHEMGQSFANLVLTGGWSGFESKRHITNNLLGMETAEADYDGLMVSPSLTLGTHIDTAGGLLTPSVRLRYAGLFLDGYSETGSSANLTVGDRSFSIFDARAQLAYALSPVTWDSGTFAPVARIGLDGTLTSGGSVDATLLNQTLDFDAADSDTLRSFMGFDASWKGHNGSSFTVSAEMGYDSAETLSAKAGATFAWEF